MNRQEQLDIISILNEVTALLANPPRDTTTAFATMIKTLGAKVKTITDLHTYEDDVERVEKEHKE